MSLEKLETAKKLLAETGLTVDEVAQTAEYSSSSYFCKKFKAQKGMSPTKFRKAAKG